MFVQMGVVKNMAEYILNRYSFTKDGPFFRDEVANVHAPPTVNRKTYNQPLLVCITQGCSTLLAFWAFVVRGHSAPCRTFASIPGLYPLTTSSSPKL